jgi:hypothetical protein
VFFLDKTQVFVWNVPLPYLFRLKATVVKRQLDKDAFMNWQTAPPPPPTTFTIFTISYGRSQLLAGLYYAKYRAMKAQGEQSNSFT